MTIYKFANREGKIISEDYNKRLPLNKEKVFDTIKKSFELFPYKVEVKYGDYEDTYHVHFINNEYKDIYFCAKGTTPGGRENLNDEQRIQVKAQYLNYIYEKIQEGFKGIFLGMYIEENVIIFCTWKVKKSEAKSPQTPISKQIKIETIGKAIQEGFVQQDKGKGEYTCAFTPYFLYFYLKNNSWLHDGRETELINYIENKDINQEESETEFNDKNLIDIKTIQKIYYGAPGTGKSYSVLQLIKDQITKYGENSVDVIRTTIYQDYSYYDFIGSIQPKVENEKIKYEFSPGPFSVALKNAIENPQKQVFLIIEEMSRGNIASIFGDTFQLLDRKNGISEYSIHNELIYNYIHLDTEKKTEIYELNTEKRVAELYNDIKYDSKKVSLPNNLHIIGTVNTSDQNVNVIDTAFKRRFSFEYVSVDPIKDNNNMYLNSFSFKLGEIEFNWIDLYRALNKFIVENLGLNEDKQIGQFFIKFDEKNEDEDSKLQIKDKLLQYLWEDIQNIAISEETIFDKEIKTFGQLYKEFENKNIFSETFMNVYNDLPKLVNKKSENNQVMNTEEKTSS